MPLQPETAREHTGSPGAIENPVARNTLIASITLVFDARSLIVEAHGPDAGAGPDLDSRLDSTLEK